MQEPVLRLRQKHASICEEQQGRGQGREVRGEEFRELTIAGAEPPDCRFASTTQQRGATAAFVTGAAALAMLSQDQPLYGKRKESQGDAESQLGGHYHNQSRR